MTYDTQAAFLTELQKTLRAARDQRSDKLLDRAGGMIDGPDFLALPEAAQTEMLELYARAYFVTRGALVG